jgi:hypothetical protein
MDHKNHNHNNSHGNGFLLGVIVGVVITLLFTTKKGRALVKELTEKGLDKFSELQKALEVTKEEFDETLEEDESGGDDYLEPEEVKEVAKLEQESKAEHEEHGEKHASNGESKHSASKRFFLRKPAKKS